MAIELIHLRKEYPGVAPLKDVNAVIQKGEIISIIGPSGTGKSTLLRCINRLETPTSGSILVDGTDITQKSCNLPKLRQKMGMVFQNFNLFSHKTVLENVSMPVHDLLKKDWDTAREEAMALLQKVGMQNKADSYPDELSGGQQQRAAIARALAMKPEIMLFDEPTSALDPTMVSEVLDVIRDIAESGTTMLIVTHEMRFARNISSRIFYMDEGEIYEDGTPDQIFNHPRREKTRAFIMRIRAWSWKIRPKDYDDEAMHISLQTFCRQQHISSWLVNIIELVVAELLTAFLNSSCIQPDSEVGLTLKAAEEASEVSLLVEYPEFSFDPLANIPDPFSRSILDAYTTCVHAEGYGKAEYNIHARKVVQENA
ncbi:MAG: amino acid ABC transporter ATP-binding protein [Stomatobaculum sp.]|nr:amino acid ABC transporter ATP-binding protein [Stomatobaculum sp.]